MAASPWTEHNFSFDGGHTRYLAAGPTDGPLIIFIHGWIAVAETWKPQITAFASLGFRVVAPDARGYGGSTSTNEVADYCIERHNQDMLALIKHLERDKAVWIGHDWGAPLVWGLASHHPEVCSAVAGICVPYHSVELGPAHLASLSNRELYPESEFPFAQWEYMKFHSETPTTSAKLIDTSPETFLKVLFLKGDPSGFEKPSATAYVRRNGGWFGDAETVAPDIPLAFTLLESHPDILESLVSTVQKHGTFGPNAYYRNVDANIKYMGQAVNGGVLDLPVLFIGARWDFICDTVTSRLSDPMKERCRNLTEYTIDAGHWVNLERPEQTNAAIVKWLATKVASSWPKL